MDRQNSATCGLEHPSGNRTFVWTDQRPRWTPPDRCCAVVAARWRQAAVDSLKPGEVKPRVGIEHAIVHDRIPRVAGFVLSDPHPGPNR